MREICEAIAEARQPPERVLKALWALPREVLISLTKMGIDSAEEFGNAVMSWREPFERTESAPVIQCPTCHDYGAFVTQDMSVRRCDCGAVRVGRYAYMKPKPVQPPCIMCGRDFNECPCEPGE